jgi:hypothetical protein
VFRSFRCKDFNPLPHCNDRISLRSTQSPLHR